MSTRLIIDGNAVYEIDEACQARKKRFAEQDGDGRRQETDRKQEAGRSRETGRILQEGQDKTKKKKQLP